MPNVGINLKMTENVSSVAPKVSSALRGVSSAGEELKESLDLGDLEQRYQKFADRVDKIHDIQARNNQQAKTMAQAGPDMPPVSKAQISKIISGVGRGAGRGAGALGEGDVGGAGTDVISTVAGLATKAGPVGIAIASIGALAFATNALSKQYEKHMAQVMDINNVLDRFGETAKETGNNFGKTMNEISEASGRYGYSLTEGMNIYKQLIKEAGTTTQEEAKDVMFFQRWGGFEAGPLAQFRGRGSRFGMGDQELLGMAYGAMGQTTMPKGLFSEFLNSTLSVFEDGISRGVVRGFDEINEIQARLGRMGPEFQGQYGLNLLKQLDTRGAAATELQSQGDLIMFNAARDMLRQQGKETDYISVQKTLEGGINQELLGSVYDQIKMRTGGLQPDMIELLKEIIPNLTYTVADKLLKELETGEEITAAYLAPGGRMRETAEMNLLTAEETIANTIRRLGKKALIPKAVTVGGLGDIIESLNSLIETREVRKETAEEWKNFYEVNKVEENLLEAGISKEGSETYNMLTRIVGPDIQQVMTRQDKYPQELVGGVREFSELMSQLGKEPLSYLSSEDFFTKLVAQGWQTMSPGETKKEYSEYDLVLALKMLTDMIGEFNKTVAEEKRVDITNYIGE